MIVEQVDPIRFVEEHFTLQGKKFTLIDGTPDNARHYLRGLYNTIIFRLPKVQKPMVFVKGRQVEMTTTMNNLVAYYLSNNKFFDILYTFPGAEQAKRFSDTRFDPLLRYMRQADLLPKLKDGTYNKSVKQFGNGSTLYVYGASDEGDKIRGIAAQMLVKDEYQDMDKSAEETIDETLTHSTYKINLSLGTPKYSGSRFDKRWLSSTMHYYHLRCPACKHYFILDMDRMAGGHLCSCPKCKNKEDKRILMPFGKWIPTGNKNADFIGFHLSQLYVPYITLEDIRMKVAQREAEGADVDRYIKNEVLGEFYSGIRQQPDKSVIMKAFNPAQEYDARFPLYTKIYMGIDWGGWNSVDQNPDNSFTVVSIGALDKTGRLVVNYIEILDMKDELAQVKRVKELIHTKRVFLALADKGYGKIKNNILMSEFPTRFRTCKYLQGSASTLYKEHDDGTILVNRDYSLEELYAAMGQARVTIPLTAHTAWVVDHFMNHEIVIVEHGGQVYKHFVKVEGHKRRTDGVHSINLLRIASFRDANASEQSALVPHVAVGHSVPRPIISGSGVPPELMTMHNNLKTMRRSLPRIRGGI